MQLGFIGLGKMGGNMVHRIHRDSDHQVVAFDYNAHAVRPPRATARPAPPRSRTSSPKLEAPRMVWLMVPSGDPTEQTIEPLAPLLERGRHDRRRRQHELARRRAPRGASSTAQGIHYVDVGTSGGVWGLEVGYCMMVGGHEESVQRLAPILDVLAPPDGWRHFGDAGAGHFVKMVHNGVEYGIMQAYAEGFELMHKSKFPIELKEVAGLWKPRLGRALLAVRAGRAARSRPRATTSRPQGPRVGLRRGPLDDRSTRSTTTCRRP